MEARSELVAGVAMQGDGYEFVAIDAVEVVNCHYAAWAVGTPLAGELLKHDALLGFESEVLH
jgi:hypothetical protein